MRSPKFHYRSMHFFLRLNTEELEGIDRDSLLLSL